MTPEQIKAAADRAEGIKPAQDDKGRFVSGNIGGGRTKGSRNKLGEAFVAALHDDFLAHGMSVIEDVRVNKPDAYLKVIASILPKEIKIESVNDLSDDELDKRIRQLAVALSLEIGTGEPAGGEEAQGGAEPPEGVSTLQ